MSRADEDATVSVEAFGYRRHWPTWACGRDDDPRRPEACVGVAFLTFYTAVNLIGIETTAALDKLLLAVQLLIVVIAGSTWLAIGAIVLIALNRRSLRSRQPLADEVSS